VAANCGSRLALQKETIGKDCVCLFQVKGALAAVEKLHNHVLQEGDGGAAGARGRKSKAGESSGTLLWARQVSGEGAHLKKWRLILRNLPFNVCTLSHASPALQSTPSLACCSSCLFLNSFCIRHGHVFGCLVQRRQACSVQESLQLASGPGTSDAYSNGHTALCI
jgi:hypothetical protein